MNSMAFSDSFLFCRFGVSIPYRTRTKRSAGDHVVHATAVGERRRRRPQNVEGEFFVDQRCIDCDTCRWMAPRTFSRVDNMSAVIEQPSSEEDRRHALQALLSCPTNSIHTEKPTMEIIHVQKLFPLAVDESRLPGIYYCGYHSEKSYGAAAYLIIHPEGNILVDSPRYTGVLARNIEIFGGAKFMFLTHMDDVADHDKWSKRFGCKRILHSRDVKESTVDVEMKLYGNGPWSIGTEFDLIHTPGHTEGSVCLYYKPLKVLFTGDHFAKTGDSEFSIFEQVNRVSVNMQLDSLRKLLDLDFKWILPGHGRSIQFRDNQEKNSALEAFLAQKKEAYVSI
ncbi:uncharacterized protein LOC110097490 isoform X1 [Dendrobium catenatum]|uniref:uncharacterized protein LOC110097490 isoform X1 n=2 Tax=Dendrobium catenatum TaxID=906689 RepID=UPI0009F16E16|nr:uncharacterized protein LOC110097490 isoform X1 [Dendrobium catenatum]